MELHCIPSHTFTVGNLWIVKQRDNCVLDLTFYIFEPTEYPLFEVQSLERYETWGSYDSINPLTPNDL
jgi:hypothetical protein